MSQPLMPTNDIHPIRLLSALFGLAFFLLMLGAAIISHRERERRAAGRILALGLLLPLPYLAVATRLLLIERGLVLPDNSNGRIRSPYPRAVHLLLSSPWRPTPHMGSDPRSSREA